MTISVHTIYKMIDDFSTQSRRGSHALAHKRLEDILTGMLDLIASHISHTGPLPAWCGGGLPIVSPDPEAMKTFAEQARLDFGVTIEQVHPMHADEPVAAVENASDDVPLAETEMEYTAEDAAVDQAAAANFDDLPKVETSVVTEALPAEDADGGDVQADAETATKAVKPGRSGRGRKS